MSLKPGSTILLRRRGKASTKPWLAADAMAWYFGTAKEPDDGWRVHGSREGGVLLSSLTVSKCFKERWLGGWPPDGSVNVTSRGLDTDGLRWQAHPLESGGFLLECLAKKRGLARWLSLTESGPLLTPRPEGRSFTHELFAMPAAEVKKIRAAEKKGDYRHMESFGMTRTGALTETTEPTTPAWARGQRPTAASPAQRAKGPVARQLVAALQPSFDDGRGGEKFSHYEPKDIRAIAWPHNVVSLALVATDTGIVHQFGEPVDHTPPKGELAHCRKLAAAVAAALKGVEPSGGDCPTPFRAFYLVIGAGEKPPKKLTADVIRKAFRGTLFPTVSIDVERIGQQGARATSTWSSFRVWATRQTDLTGLCFVRVGFDDNCYPNLACVFPRLVLGLTKAGSIVGACATVVQA